jgi:hypothetical protein
MKYEVDIIKAIDYLIDERVSEAQELGWELNGPMLLYRGRCSGGEGTFAAQPVKRIKK